MTPAIIGRKVGMTRIYDERGTMVPVTVVQAGPCSVTQVKTVETDGYNAVQLGYLEVKPRASTMPLIGHCAKSGTSPRRYFAEIRLAAAPDVTAGQTVSVDAFKDVLLVDIIGTSKGKGTAGVMKRYNFGGQPASHGTERKHRSPGSLASRAANRGFVGKPKKGVRMAGHLGMERVTTRNHAVLKIDSENNLILIKGALPGPNGGVVFIRQAIAAGQRAAKRAEKHRASAEAPAAE